MKKPPSSKGQLCLPPGKTTATLTMRRIRIPTAPKHGPRSRAARSHRRHETTKHKAELTGATARQRGTPLKFAIASCLHTCSDTVINRSAPSTNIFTHGLPSEPHHRSTAFIPSRTSTDTYILHMEPSGSSEQKIQKIYTSQIQKMYHEVAHSVAPVETHQGMKTDVSLLLLAKRYKRAAARGERSKGRRAKQHKAAVKLQHTTGYYELRPISSEKRTHHPYHTLMDT